MTEAPQTIGPYRVLQRLGQGGMGEVFLAYDERLDRRVAIKRIRPDAGTSPERRERFRREARVSARLNHPAIVQIYDILTEGDLEHIVMEHVEGADLHKLLARGPLEVPQVIKLARQLADGLDAAHRQGVVHRDFKAENVLVTAAGQAKIADFGIAKQLLAASDEPEESLTGGNVVLGTYRTMSPEQARGETVDHRTDLFALGVLLYEALTGRSPFAAENALATLSRVIHVQQEPVRSLRSSVPEALSMLVDDLLRKEPALRPQSAAQVRRELDAMDPATSAGGTETLAEPVNLIPSKLSSISSIPSLPSIPQQPDSALTTLKARPRLFWWITIAAAVLAVLALTGGYLALRRPPPPLYVAVLRPDVGAGSGTAESQLLASGVRSALLQALVSLAGISPKALDEVDSATGPPRQVAKTLSADEIVSSRLDCRPESCRISLNRIRGEDGSVLWAESFEVPTDDFSLVASAVTRQLRRGYSGHEVRKGVLDLAVSGRDLERFLQLRQSVTGQQTASVEPVLAGLEAIRRSSPRFIDVYVLEANVLRRRFWRSRDPQDLQRGFDLLRTARELAPDDPQPLFARIDLALAGEDIPAAEKSLDELAEILPGDVRVLERRSRILSARGETGEALALMRTAAQLHPSSSRLSNLAQMEFQQGEIAAARQHLELLLQRSPGNFNGLSILAMVELSAGDLNRAVQLYGDLVRRSPGLAELSNLGLAYFFLGRYAEAAAAYEQVLGREPNNPEYALNLADAYLLLRREAEAKALYRRVADLAAGDPGGRGPQLLATEAQALAHLGQGRQAVAAVQEALRLAPNDGPVAWEASVVYALLGEDDSALANAEKALQLGLEDRWFSFPWFATLRTHPEFQSLLKRKAAQSGGL